MKNMWSEDQQYESRTKEMRKWGSKEPQQMRKQSYIKKRGNAETTKQRDEESKKQGSLSKSDIQGEGRAFQPSIRSINPFCWIRWHKRMKWPLQIWSFQQCTDEVTPKISLNTFCPSWPQKEKTRHFLVLQKAHVTKREMPPIFRTKNHTSTPGGW